MEKGNPLTLLAGMQTGTATMEDCTMENSTMWRVLKKLGIELPYDPEIPLLVICPKETRTERHTCTPVFTDRLGKHVCIHACTHALSWEPSIHFYWAKAGNIMASYTSQYWGCHVWNPRKPGSGFDYHCGGQWLQHQTTGELDPCDHLSLRGFPARMLDTVFQPETHLDLLSSKALKSERQPGKW